MNATAMLTRGTDMLSSTNPVVGSDSTAVATKEINATLFIVKTQSNWKYPRTEK